MPKAKFMLLALVALSLLAYAGEGRKTDKSDHMARMKTELNLTDDQAARVAQAMNDLKPLRERVMKARQDLADARKANADKETISKKEAELAAARSEFNARHESEMRSILTAEQFAKWKETAAAHHKGDKMGGHEGPHGKTEKHKK